jgi:hypothetical protein
MHERSRLRRQLAIVGLVLFASYAYFYEAGGWNQNTRYDLVRAIVWHHSLRIDRYEANTGDKARHDGHVYSDKAPGLSLTAVPIVAAARAGLDAAGIPPDSEQSVVVGSYLATAATAALPTALAAVIVGAIAVTLFASASASVFAAIAFGLATPAWAYATIFYGHQLAAFGILAAFGAALMIRRCQSDADRMRWGLLVGACAGWATVTEYTSAIPAAIMALLAVVEVRDARWQARAIVAAAVTVAALACAGVLVWYNLHAFGAALAVSYTSEQGFSEMKTGLFGITYPKLPVMRELLVGQYRGLLLLSPVLALAPVGYWLWVRRARDRAAVVAAAVVPLYYFLLNSSYFYWEGGWSYGPRHMAPSLPFLALALAALWAGLPRSGRLALGWLCAVCIFLTLVGVATTPQPPSIFTRPLAELWWPAFLDGDLSLNHTSFDMASWNPTLVRHHPEAHKAWNVGERAGLRGWASLAPLLALWAAAAWALGRGSPSSRADAASRQGAFG